MTELNWTFPYASQRMPLFARSVVATSQPLAAQAGLQMMRDGGNAVDAAIATAVAMTVLEPTTNGIGSDAFALIWMDGKLHGLNGSGRSPRALSADRFEGQHEMPKRGWDPVTVPGAVSAWMECSKRLGRLPFAKLIEPAIELAEKGYHVSPLTSGLWQRAETAYEGFGEFNQTFLIDGKAPHPGQLITLPNHAATLTEIAQTRGESFYRGRLANAIAGAAKADGGLMSFNDLAAHSADWVEPISIGYRGWRLHEIPPNGQGLAALMALGILKHFDLDSLQVDCPDVIHLQIEAMKLAFADAHRFIADPRFMDVQVSQLLDEAYLESRATLINPGRSQDFQHGQPKPGGTILLTAADASGGMVSFIQSNYTGFGSGVVIPGTGIAMQNRGACFTLEKGHPNEVGGGKRPYHTIIPGFVTRTAEAGPERSEGPDRRQTAGVQPLMAFGVMGGFMQPQGHIQVIIRMADFGQNPQAAIDAPRWQVTEGLKVTIEPGFDASLYNELKSRGHVINMATERSVTFGRGQAIYRLDDGGYCGASDGRGDGQAVGW